MSVFRILSLFTFLKTIADVELCYSRLKEKIT